jgi:CheY-like chemotaxis protein
MSLQDKKMQLLNHDKSNDDVVEDIFSQYGAGEESSQPTASTNDVQENDNDLDPIESVVEKLNKDVEVEVPDDKRVGDEKKEDIQDDDLTDDLKPEPVDDEKRWEKEFTKNTKHLPETAVIDDASTEDKMPEQESELPVSTVAPQKANMNSVIHSQPPQQKEAIKKNVKSTYQAHKKIDPSKKTILIVDDDVDTLDMYADIFENADYNVLRAIDGLDALNVVSDHTPHVIFTGIVMPRMDGFALMDALQKNKRTADIPVVINSHLGRAHDKERANELGAKDFIVRGFTPPREALERIGALLMRSEYVFRFDHNDPQSRKLAKDLGAENFFMCPRGQEMVLKLSVIDPKDLTFSARFSCVDEKNKNR